MSIFSYTNNYLFFHIPKCGGTSIYQVLPNKEKVNLIDHTHYDYVNTKLAFEQNNQLDIFNKSKKFAIIRNPFDRTVSLYRYIKEHKDHPLHNRLLKHDFTQFCYFLRNVGDESITSCHEHLSDDNGFIDDSIKIFKLEEINNHLEEISNIIGSNVNEMPNVNKSSISYQKTEESDLLIKDVFIEDLEIFYEELL